MSERTRCRVCDGSVDKCLDFGRQPLSDAFLDPAAGWADEFFYRLAVGVCRRCTAVQLMEEIPRDRMFHHDYPYRSSGSVRMRRHFEEFAKRLLVEELTGRDPFVVEIGCNDGVMLKTIADAGVRHLGLEPSGAVARIAAGQGVRVRESFFEETVAADVRAQEGPAQVIYAANTLCHIPYLNSVLAGVASLLAPDGVFIFEDPYLGDIVKRRSFDQIYDEHFFLFTAGSVRSFARRHRLELVEVEGLPVHGGELRYTLARAGRRQPSPAVETLVAAEQRLRLGDPETLVRFGAEVERIRADLLQLLRELRAAGKRVVGYGATAKSATVTNFCGIGPELVEFICDSTPAKQGRLAPGSHIPVRPTAAFADPYPDYALLFAWNHADEIMAKEQEFGRRGGRWIQYVPEVTVSATVDRRPGEGRPG